MCDTNKKQHHVFNFQLQRLMIGLVALFLPLFVIIFGCDELSSISISASYHTASRDIFVASLASVGLFMITYQGENGSDICEFWVSKVGGVAALVVAFVPTEYPLNCNQANSCFTSTACKHANETIHVSAAIIVFLCLFFLPVVHFK